MKKFIEKISTVIPYTEKQIEIDLRGKNLILTGGNGSGKTSLVASIYQKLINIVRSKALDNLMALEEERTRLVNQRGQAIKGDYRYEKATRRIEELAVQIERITSNPNISINNYMEFGEKLDSEVGIIELFHAGRRSEIYSARNASGTKYNKNDLINPDSRIENQLEQHLVNLYTRRSFSITEDRNQELENEITKWFSNFEYKLKFLMEDDSVFLKFDADEFKFYIIQNGKLPYTFQNLSSGYSSIFSVFSKLLMRAEYLKVSPLSLCGVVIIDEIDAHLHVTLQRKILPFLSDSFPGVQYIVTTHSPFVLTSVSDAEIYDISRGEQVGDLSSYSYEAVLGGLFGVSSASDILQNKIRELSKIIKSDESSPDELQKLIDELDREPDNLDEEAKFYLNSAKLKMHKLNQGGDK
ncbi:MAG: hypothetical protein B0W54_01130 [Cellvibrio sp. 79]|nr:MAG: hypothetical protein B0W54_01130 [Cellvibrio sp. 79]